MTRSTLWYVLPPGASMAEGPLRFTEEKTEQEVRAYIRERDGLATTRGWQLWTTTEQALSDLNRNNDEFARDLRQRGLPFD